MKRCKLSYAHFPVLLVHGTWCLKTSAYDSLQRFTAYRFCCKATHTGTGHDVLQHRHIGKQGIILEQESDIPLVGRKIDSLVRVKDSGSIFDPGAVVDDNGDAWVAFGSGQGWIAKLNPDLRSLDGKPVKLPSAYHFEANELNYIGGTYVYTYNNDWSDHTPWTWGGTKPTMCSMNYFTSKTPLVTDSWTYGANYFKNPGENNMGYTNNHTHLHKYQDKWYLFYQTNLMQGSLGTDGGFRSIYVDQIAVDEENVVIHECIPTKKGVSAIKNLDPYSKQPAATSAATLGIVFNATDTPGHMTVSRGTPCTTANKPKTGVIEVRNVDFASGAKSVSCRLKGEGNVSFRLDSADADDFVTVTGPGSDWKDRTVSCTPGSGVHMLYIVLTGNAELDSWQFNK